MATILNPNDPGLYRNQRGRRGNDPLMVRDSAPRHIITSGAGAVSDGYQIPDNWRRVFDPSSPSFALLALAVFLFLIHGRIDLAVKGGVKK